MDRRRNVLLQEKKQRKSSGLPSLLDAARNNDKGQIQAALRNGQDINTHDETGNTALHQAAMFNLYDVISYLIFSGADPEIKNKEGQRVADVCRDTDMTSFLTQINRLTVREDYGKISEDIVSLTDEEPEAMFKSSYVTVSSQDLAEDEILSLRCRSIRLEEAAWQFLKTTETACSDVYIISTNKVKVVEDIEFEIPLYNLPKPTEEIVIRTNTNVTFNDVISFDKKRASFCKFNFQLPPVVAFVAVCRHKTEVFEVNSDTKELVSQIDKDVKISLAAKSVITSGQLELKIYNSSEYANSFEKVGGPASRSIIAIQANDIDHAGSVATISIPLSKTYDSPERLQVLSVQTAEENSAVGISKGDMADSGQLLTVPLLTNGLVVVMETKVSDENATIIETTKEVFGEILHKDTPLQFQIGSKQGRNEQKRCKVLVTCSLEEEADKNVAFWEHDGFHIQWCTETIKGTSGETFAITLGGAMVFCNGFGDEKIQFHPRRRNHLVFEVMTNDVLSNVSVSNVEIRPCSSTNPTVTYSAPLKKIVYIRKTNTLEEIGFIREKSDTELMKEKSNVSDNLPKPKKKKKKTVLKKMSRENTKQMNVDNTDDGFHQVCKEKSSTSLKDEAKLDELLRESSDSPQSNPTPEVNNVLVKGKDEITIDEDLENKDPKQKETTDISSKSPTTSLTSLDAEDDTSTKRSEGKKPVPTLLRRASTDISMVKDDTLLTSRPVKDDTLLTTRPVTTRSILLENPAVLFPVERTFFSDAYLSIILDDIGANWLVIYILIGIPFDVIDDRLTKLHGKSPLHEILLHLLQEWRDEHAFHVHKGVPNMLSALRKGGKWDLSVSVQRRLKIWHDQGLDVKDEPLYSWLDRAYADSDVFIPTDYPRPMSDSFLMMFAPEVNFSNHVTTALSLTYEEYYDIQDNAIYTNDTLKVMKALTVYRSKKVNIMEMLEELIELCDELSLKRASHIIVVSLKGWLKRSAPDNDHLKSAIGKLVSKLLERGTKCNTPNSIFRQRLDVHSALRILRTPANTRPQRQVRSEYGKPSTSK